LDLYNSVVWRFIKPSYGVSIYFKDIALKKTVAAVSLPKFTDIALIGVTRREADTALAPENGVMIEFFDGYNWDVFSGSGGYCLLSEGVNYDDSADIVEVKIKDTEENIALAVVGIITGVTDKLYVPWGYVIDYLEDGLESSETLRAVVADNRKLSEMKERMGRYFIPVSPFNTTVFEYESGEPQYKFALTVFDAQYLESHKTISQNIKLIETARMVFWVLSILIGFLSGCILLRTRKREYALLRVVGFGKARSHMLFIIEYMVETAISAVMAIILGIIFPVFDGMIIFAAMTAACFLAGVVSASLLLLRESTLKSLQTNE
jgi:hypothetical protein